jgi:tetratricopeptide (TPR) repeat protein
MSVIKSELQISRKELLEKEALLKGNEQLGNRDYNNALKYFDEALEINPNSIYAWGNKGLVLARLGMHDKDIMYFDKALEIDPNNALVWGNKAWTLDKSGRHNEAKKLKVIKKESSSIEDDKRKIMANVLEIMVNVLVQIISNYE